MTGLETPQRQADDEVEQIFQQILDLFQTLSPAAQSDLLEKLEDEFDLEEEPDA